MALLTSIAFDGEDWELETKFTGDGSQTTTFGRSVAIYDNVIAVGDTGVVFNPGEGEDGYGAAFMYRYNGTNWNLEAKLRGDNVTPAQGLRTCIRRESNHNWFEY
jgi:hypothetical protein